MSAPSLGSPAWYDQEIDWLVAHEPLEQRVRINRLVQIRNALARRCGEHERTLPLHVAWYLAVDMAASWRELWIMSARRDTTCPKRSRTANNHPGSRSHRTRSR